MNEFVTWDYLGTFVGCVASVSFITQFLKSTLDKYFPNVSTKLWALLISLLLLLAVDGAKGQLNMQNVTLSIINSFVVAVAAMGSYDLGVRVIGGKE